MEFWQHPHPVYLEHITEVMREDEFWPDDFERLSLLDYIMYVLQKVPGRFERFLS
jgi:hypothetical protein